MIAALYVIENGPYYGLPNVDPWPESRDARTYAGPHPVVAHPPCSRWCRLAAFGVELPELLWGRIPNGESKALVSWCGNHVKTGEKRPRVSKKAASKSPPAFRDALIAMAGSVRAPAPEPPAGQMARDRAEAQGDRDA